MQVFIEKMNMMVRVILACCSPPQEGLCIALPEAEIKLEDNAPLWMSDGCRTDYLGYVDLWGSEFEPKTVAVQILIYGAF
ncbi:MAG: hypothetical protein CSA45_04425 [Gammaproteobacteria bacterium]|nr:MAG: hypothetical protein CSA45_04425 [Gammaproteobacteria bacterium]